MFKLECSVRHAIAGQSEKSPFGIKSGWFLLPMEMRPGS